MESKDDRDFITMLPWDEVDEDLENIPVMNWPYMSSCAVEEDSAAGKVPIPWADIHGPPQRRTLTLGTAPAPRRHHREPSPSVNPFSSFGFITLSVSADRYVADANDPMDVEVARHLRLLDKEAVSALVLRRLAPGKYEIDGRPISLHWGGSWNAEVFVREGESDGQNTTDSPLYQYLFETASIAARIKQPMAPRTLTFVDQEDVNVNDRYESMQIACKQAQLREEAAGLACLRETTWRKSAGSQTRPPLQLRMNPQIFYRSS